MVDATIVAVVRGKIMVVVAVVVVTKWLISLKYYEIKWVQERG